MHLKHVLLVRQEHVMDERLEHVPHSGCASQARSAFLRQEHVMDVHLEHISTFWKCG